MKDRSPDPGIYSFLARATAVWVLIVVVETVHGVARRLILEPLIGDLRSRRFAVLTGSVLIFAVAFVCVPRLKGTRCIHFIAAGLFWVVLTLCFEFGMGMLLGLSWERILSDYDMPNGGLLPIGLFLMFLSPLGAAKLRNEV